MGGTYPAEGGTSTRPDIIKSGRNYASLSARSCPPLLRSRSIVDAHVSPRGALVLAGVMLFAAVAAVVPTVTALRAGGAARELEVTFWVGVGMVFSYTCWPFRWVFLDRHGGSFQTEVVDLFKIVGGTESIISCATQDNFETRERLLASGRALSTC